MARMHTRRRGRSRSKHPVAKTAPSWVKITSEQVVELVVKLAKEGKTLSQIGVILRDQYGVPSVKAVTGQSMLEILESKGAKQEWPEDLMNLIKKAVRLRKHVATNKEDVLNKRALILVESKIRRLASYYRKTGAIPKTWFYEPQAAALLIKQ